MKRPGALAAALVLLAAASPAGTPPCDERQVSPWDGNRVTPVHLIPVKDEFDQPVIPGEPYPLPLSSRFTCAPCHDYEIIRRGLHFNPGGGKPAGRSGEPWIWLDEASATVLPLSNRGWPGTWAPSALGLSDWEFTRLFGRHMTGGGSGEPAPESWTAGSRWEVSGTLEINCLGCHNASPRQSHSEWAKQVLRENFRWAATAAAGLGEVGGMASRLPATWTVIDGPNPDDTEYAVVPQVAFDAALFDSAHRVFFEIEHRPPDDRCLACHSSSPAGSQLHAAERDVHSAAGLRCADCHRNDLGHGMLRGYEEEARESGDPLAAQFTCRGCHVGPDNSRRGGPSVGRLGAPFPEHKGFPKVHFERLSCTVCHSGPLPAGGPSRVRTSRANRLGVYGVARWDTPLPFLAAPVYLRDPSGRLTPQRVLWPSWWGKEDADGISPLRPEEVTAAAGEPLRSEERAARLLAALAFTDGLEGEPVFLTGERLFRANLDGGLDMEQFTGESAGVDPYWAVRGDGELLPLLPDFDPGAEAPDPGIESRVQAVLEALAAMDPPAGDPVVSCGPMLYRLVDGYLDKQERAGETAPHPVPGWLREGGPAPLISEFDLRVVRATAGEEALITEEQVEAVLTALDGNRPCGAETAGFVYVSGGRIFRKKEDGGLSARPGPAAEPAAWPLAHDVRSARQSLGINGCTDCHSAASDFFFASVRAEGPLKTDRFDKRSGAAWMGLSPIYQRIFGLTFIVRPALKWLLGAAVLAAGLVLLLAAALALGRLTGLLEKPGRREE